jgi:queuine tRNA-ribosyltransferase|tara:strand:+ start:574 stop:1419 length:846 start_codon:yes stop_codon:yes gene_type:complete
LAGLGSIQEERETKRAHQKPNSNASVLKITEEGVSFRSYRDGTKIFLSPESSVDAQKAFGADIIIPLDELPPHNIDDATLMSSLKRTHRWEKRSLDRHLENIQQQAMYGVIHGSTSTKLRELSTDIISSMEFDGLAIGGSLGTTKEDLIKIFQAVMPKLHQEETPRPVHLLGIGDEESIVEGIKYGIDQFDSALPTKVARHGTIFLKTGRINIRASKWKNDLTPLDEACDCTTCLNHSKAYLHHLWKANEPVVHNLLSHHNLKYTLNVMKEQREGILAGRI